MRGGAVLGFNLALLKDFRETVKKKTFDFLIATKESKNIWTSRAFATKKTKKPKEKNNSSQFHTIVLFCFFFASAHLYQK